MFSLNQGLIIRKIHCKIWERTFKAWDEHEMQGTVSKDDNVSHTTLRLFFSLSHSGYFWFKKVVQRWYIYFSFEKVWKINIRNIITIIRVLRPDPSSLKTKKPGSGSDQNIRIRPPGYRTGSNYFLSPTTFYVTHGGIEKWQNKKYEFKILFSNMWPHILGKALLGGQASKKMSFIVFFLYINIYKIKI